MDLSNYTLGLGITGSFCTFSKALENAEKMTGLFKRVIPVYSYNTQMLNTRFTTAKAFMDKMTEITGEKGMRTIQDAETVGPNKIFDIMLIYPCTGNTMAKLVNGMVDTPVLMAAKAHLRNQKPLVLGISTNDGMGMNFANLGRLANVKNVYLVPFGQDDSVKKPNSLVCYQDKIPETLEAAMEGRQLQPVLTR